MKQLYKMLDQPAIRAEKIYNYTLLVEEKKGSSDPTKAAKKAKHEFYKAVAAAPTIFWCPNGKQEELIETFANSVYTKHNPSNIATIVSTFANGVGKTETAINICINLIFGPQNGWFDHTLFNKWTMPKTIWYCSTPKMLVNKIVPKILQLANSIKRLPINVNEKNITEKYFKGYEHDFNKKSGSKWVESIDFGNGWKIQFWSYGQDPADIEGEDVGLIINDEPAPEAFNKAQKSRRRLGNITMHVMTPLWCDPYLVDDYKKAKEQDVPGIYIVEASVFEASTKNGVRGHLNPVTIERMIEEYDEDEKEARVWGRFMFYSTKIYKSFNRRTHVVTKFKDDSGFGFKYHGKKVYVPEGSILKFANDPKDGTADAVVYAWVFPNGRKYIFAETPIKNTGFYWKMKIPQTPREKILEWIKLERRLNLKVDRRIIDKIFAIQQTRGNDKIVDQYEREAHKLEQELGTGDMNFLFWESHGRSDDMKMIKYRHNMVNQDLAIQPDNIPNLLIDEDCPHSIRGIEHYVRSHNANQLEKIMEVDAPPVPKFKDFPDAIGFLVCDDGNTKRTEKRNQKYSTGKDVWYNHI